MIEVPDSMGFACNPTVFSLKILGFGTGTIC
jgi:hypothetical protein